MRCSSRARRRAGRHSRCDARPERRMPRTGWTPTSSELAAVDAGYRFGPDRGFCSAEGPACRRSNRRSGGCRTAGDRRLKQGIPTSRGRCTTSSAAPTDRARVWFGRLPDGSRRAAHDVAPCSRAHPARSPLDAYRSWFRWPLRQRSSLFTFSAATGGKSGDFPPFPQPTRTARGWMWVVDSPRHHD